MILVRHVLSLVVSTGRYGLSTRKAALLLSVVLGLCLIALSLAAATAAPFMLYPFA